MQNRSRFILLVVGFIVSVFFLIPFFSFNAISGDSDLFAATLSIDDDANNNGAADPNELIKFSGTGWGGTSVRQFQQLEYSDYDGTVLVATKGIRNYSATFNGGNLVGSYYATSSFTTGAKVIRIRIQDSAGSVGISDPFPIAEYDPPDILSATAINLTTIEIVFDEIVKEVNGDAAARFLLSGDDVFGLSVLSVNPVGSSPTDTWRLTLDGELGDRDPDNVTVAYDSTASTSDPQLQDFVGNQVNDESSATVADGIAPANPTRLNPTASSDFSGGSVKWTATADDITTDPSISYLQLEGSDDELSWTAVGPQDNSTSTTTYTGEYFLGTEYAYYRIKAVDDQGNESYSSSVGNFQNAQRIRITSSPVNEPVNTYEDQITFQIVDAYGNPENVSLTLDLNMTSGSGVGTFRENPTGPNITSITLSGQNSGSFYFACTTPGSKTIQISNAGLISGSQTAIITGGSAANILIKLPGQSFVNGTGITGSPTSQTAGVSFNINLYIVDADNFLVTGENSAREIDFTSNTADAPDGTSPTIAGRQPDTGESTTWSDISVSFSDGVSSNIAVVFYKAESGVNITASDNSGSPNLNGVTSSDFTLGPGILGDFLFSLSSPQTDGFPVSGTNTLTARDLYQNVKTDFDASATPVTLSKNAGPGDLSIKGLGGAQGDQLNQAGDFSQGVADLTSLGMRIDVTQEGDYQLKAVVGGSDKGASNNVSMQFREVTVSDPNTAADANIDASGTAGDLSLSANVSAGEETNYDYNDDFQIKWGFSNNADGSNMQLEGSSGNLVVAGAVSYDVPAATLQAGSAYNYFFWWVQNENTVGNSSQLLGGPIETNKRRLVINPTLNTSGSDVSGGSFSPGVTNQEVLSIQFSPDPTQATIQVVSLDFQKSGTATGSDVDNFHLYEDKGTAGVYDGQDVLLSSVPYSGGATVSFSGFSLDVVDPATNVLVTVDINAAANTSATLGLTLANEGDVGVGDNVLNGPASAIQKATFQNIGTSGDNPLPVSLLSFTAEAGYDCITLRWITASEMDNEGFFLYRAEQIDGDFLPLNVSIIPGKGTSTTTQEYEYVDKSIEKGLTYYYKLISRDFNGTLHVNGIISAKVELLPVEYRLYQNYPNPFNPATRLRFDLPEETGVFLEIYNILGQKVRTLLDGVKFAPGSHEEFFWDARDDQGNMVGNGVYYILLRTENNKFRQLKKAIYLK
ncbi:MAG: hypothetical protein Kow0042_30540 [Calditrichia bacterium]